MDLALDPGREAAPDEGAAERARSEMQNDAPDRGKVSGERLPSKSPATPTDCLRAFFTRLARGLGCPRLRDSRPGGAESTENLRRLFESRVGRAKRDVAELGDREPFTPAGLNPHLLLADVRYWSGGALIAPLEESLYERARLARDLLPALPAALKPPEQNKLPGATQESGTARPPLRGAAMPNTPPRSVRPSSEDIDLLARVRAIDLGDDPARWLDEDYGEQALIGRRRAELEKQAAALAAAGIDPAEVGVIPDPVPALARTVSGVRRARLSAAAADLLALGTCTVADAGERRARALRVIHVHRELAIGGLEAAHALIDQLAIPHLGERPGPGRMEGGPTGVRYVEGYTLESDAMPEPREVWGSLVLWALGEVAEKKSDAEPVDLLPWSITPEKKAQMVLRCAADASTKDDLAEKLVKEHGAPSAKAVLKFIERRESEDAAFASALSGALVTSKRARQMSDSARRSKK